MKMLRRGLKYAGMALAALLGLALLALAWLLLTTSGARTAAAVADAVEPRLDLRVVGGSLARGVAVEAVAWRDDGLEVAVDEADLRWWPLQLLQGEVQVDRLALTGVDVTLPEGGAAPAEPAPGAAGDAIALPAIDLPVALALEQFQLERLRLDTGAEPVQRIRRIEAAASAAGHEWHLRRLRVEHDDAQVTAEGKLHTTDAYPLTFFVRGSVGAPMLPERLRFATRLDGTVAALRTTSDLAGPVSGRVDVALRPLEPGLPLQIVTDDVALGWPLGTRKTVSAAGLDLTASGDLDGIAGRLETQLDGGFVPQGEWQGAFRADADGVVFETLSASLLDGHLDGEARLGWGADGVRWDVTARTEGLDASGFQDQAPDAITGPLAVTGRAGGGGWALRIETEGLRGEWQGRTVAVDGAAEHTLDGAWRFRALRAEVPGGELRIDGELAETWDVALRAELSDLSALDERLGGEVEGRARVTGPPGAPDIASEGRGRGLSWAEHRVDAVDWQVDIPALGRQAGEARVDVRGIRLPQVAGGEVTLRATGTRESHQLSLRGQAEAGAAHLELAGGWRPASGWDGRVTGAGGEVAGHTVALAAPFPLRYADGAVEAGAHAWRYRGARLRLPEGLRADPEGTGVAFTLADFDLAWLEPLLPEPLDWQGSLAGEGELRWTPEQGVDARMSAESGDGRLVMETRRERDAEADDPEADSEPVIQELAYQRLALSGRYRPERAEAALELEAAEAGSATLRVAGDPRPEGEAVSGSLALDGLRLGLFRPLVPQLSELAGVARADIQLSGTRTEPRLDGELELREGRVAAPQSGSTVEALDLRVELDGTEAAIDGDFRVGEGEATLDGTAAWRGGDWRLALDLTGEELLADVPPYAELAVSPRLGLSVEPGTVQLDGRVAIPSGRITVRELPQQAVARSGDVVVVTERAEPEASPAPVSEGWRAEADVEVAVGDAVSLAALGVRGRLTGSLRTLRHADGALEAFGELRIADGEYRAYGQRLQIRRGLLIFAGPLSRPQLDIEAVRRIPRDDVIAGLRLDGFADSPQAHLFSEPAMSQENALSYLIRGRPLGAEGPGSDQMLASAALALGLYGGSGVASSVAERAGVEDFQIEATGEGDGTQVVLSGYISPRLYVAYGVGVFSPVNTVTLRYALTRQLYLEAVDGEDSALDLMYRFEIDGP